jgi:hypothetical protein
MSPFCISGLTPFQFLLNATLMCVPFRFMFALYPLNFPLYVISNVCGSFSGNNSKNESFSIFIVVAGTSGGLQLFLCRGVVCLRVFLC